MTQVHSKYRHKKRGGIYNYISHASVQAEHPIKEGDKVVVYTGENGQMWVRPHHEFHDGRFEPVAG